MYVYYDDGNSSQWVATTSPTASKGEKGEKGEKRSIDEKGNKGVNQEMIILQKEIKVMKAIKGKKYSPGYYCKRRKGDSQKRR